MEIRERPNAQTYQNFEELASGLQECKLAGLRSCGGRAHNKSSSTSMHRMGWSDCNILKLPDGASIRFGSLNWAGGLE